MRQSASSRFVICVVLRSETFGLAEEQPPPQLARTLQTAIRLVLEAFDGRIQCPDSAFRKLRDVERAQILADLLAWDGTEPFVWDDGDLSRDMPSVGIRVDHVQEVGR